LQINPNIYQQENSMPQSIAKLINHALRLTSIAATLVLLSNPTLSLAYSAEQAADELARESAGKPPEKPRGEPKVIDSNTRKTYNNDRRKDGCFDSSNIYSYITKGGCNPPGK